MPATGLSPTHVHLLLVHLHLKLLRMMAVGVGRKTDDRRPKPKRPRPNPKRPRPKWPIKYWVENFIDRIKFGQFGHFVLSNRIDRTDRILRKTVPIFRFFDMREMWYSWMFINFSSVVTFLFRLLNIYSCQLIIIYVMKKHPKHI
jgi:hypothetical protein